MIFLVSGKGLPPQLPLCSRGRGSHYHDSSSGILIKMKDSISFSTNFNISVNSTFHSFYNWDLNKVGSCPENWQEMKITQDSGEVPIQSQQSSVTYHPVLIQSIPTHQTNNSGEVLNPIPTIMISSIILFVERR